MLLVLFLYLLNKSKIKIIMKNKLLFQFSLLLVLIFQISSAQVPSFVPYNGLVGYWAFSSNANDESGIGNNGTVNGATLTNDRYGNSNSAYSFDGLTNYITVPTNSSISNFPNGQSISFWINVSIYPKDGKEHYIIDKSDDIGKTTTKFYQTYISDLSNVDGIIYRYANTTSSSSQGTFASYSNIPLNQWVHICYTTDLTTTKTYINGVLFQTYEQYSSIGVTSNPLLFGKRNTDGSSDFAPFNGILDDVAIWNRVLSTQEITNMYNGFTYSDTCNAVSGSLTQGLVGYWPFCGNANDDSGKGNNGTVNGATLTTDRFGNANSAYSFDGNSNYIVVPNSSNLNSNNKTLSVWVNYTSEPTNVSSGAMALISKWYQITNCNNTFNDAYILTIGKSNNQTKIIGATNIYSQSTLTTNNYSTNTWYNIVFTHDSEIGGKIYVNGVLVSSNTLTGSICSNQNPLYFGADNNMGTIYRFLNGKLDDIGIWNRALTQEEITNVYNTNQCFTNTTVTDALIINVGQLSYTNPIAYSNKITIAPNPASTQININFNNISDLNGGTLKIINSLGQQVATTPIKTSGTNSTMQLATWGGAGMYFVQIINPQGQIVDVKKIILQ